MPPPADEIQNLTRIATYANYFNFGLVLLAGLAAIFAYRWSSKAQDMITAESNRQIANANEKTEALRRENLNLVKDVSGLQIEVANAKERQAIAETDLFKLKEKFRPRVITEAQKENLIGYLKKHSKGGVLIYAVATDSETFSYSRQIGDVLTKAGWRVEFFDTVSFGGVVEDVTIEVNRANSLGGKLGGTIQTAFKLIGITLYGRPKPELAEDEIHIIVGMKTSSPVP